MKFTDKDIDRLKEQLPLIETYGRWLTNRERVEALLHRLECAEECALNLSLLHPDMKCLKPWLKSRGDE